MTFEPLKFGLQLGAAFAAFGLAAAAQAGDCPAGQMRPDARAPGETGGRRATGS